MYIPKLVLDMPGKWHNVRTIVNLIYICRETDAQMYVYIYIYMLYKLVVYIYI